MAICEWFLMGALLGSEFFYFYFIFNLHVLMCVW